jgi:hypothetical protein
MGSKQRLIEIGNKLEILFSVEFLKMFLFAQNALKKCYYDQQKNFLNNST